MWWLPYETKVHSTSALTLSHPCQFSRQTTVIPNFGFAKPATYRHLIDQMTQGVIIIYPSRDPSPGSDEGPEISITYEKSLKENLINDPEWCKYFEYRGVDAVQAP